MEKEGRVRTRKQECGGVMEHRLKAPATLKSLTEKEFLRGVEFHRAIVRFDRGTSPTALKACPQQQDRDTPSQA
jgi:hypothetical protein